MADVAVVVGNHQGEAVLPDCLGSLRTQTLPPAEVLVVDGASTDRSVAVAATFGARVIEAPNNGLGHLYNVGAHAAFSEYVLLANNDIALEATCLELLAAALDEDESRFAADAHQLSWDGARTVHAATTLGAGRLLREYLPGLHLDDLVSATDTTPTVSAHGAAMLVRRSMMLELGGFDETFFMEWEDLDLCWRAWMRGWASVYVPDAVVRHRVGAVTTRKVLPRRLASSHHNLMRFALKCLPAWPAARVVLGELLRLPAHPRAIASAFLAVGRELPEIRRLRAGLRPSPALLEWMLAGSQGSPPTA